MGHKVFDFLADFTTSFDLDADSNGTNAAKQMRTVMLAKSSRTVNGALTFTRSRQQIDDGHYQRL